MRYLKFLSAFLFLLSLNVTAGAQGWKWCRGARGPYPTEGAYAATDGAGSVYGSGVSNNTAHFGTDTTAPNTVYVVKYDSSGNLKWLVNAVSLLMPTSLGMATDLFGNEYIFGSYQFRIIIGTDTALAPTYPANYYFIAKMDSAGHPKWIKNVGNVLSAGLYQYSGIVTDAQGNFYITGSFTGSSAIGPHTLVNDTTDGSPDIFVAKYDSSGTVSWVRTIGGSKNDYPTGITVSATNEVYLTGNYNSAALNIGPFALPDTSTIHAPSFLAKLDGNTGVPTWAKVMCYGETNALEASPESGVYVTGNYHNMALRLDTITLPTAPFSGYFYGYLAKYDSSGNVQWAKAMTGNVVTPFSQALDPCGNIWVSGEFGTGVCTSVIDGHTFTSPAGSHDPMFIAGWTDAGTYLQASVLSSGGDDQSGIAFDCAGHMYIVGDDEATMMAVGPDTLFNDSEFNFVARYDADLGCQCPTAALMAQNSTVKNMDISLYPNPAYAIVTISATAPFLKNATATISDLTGRQLHTYTLTGNTTEIPVADLPPGMYVCRIDAGGGSVVSRKLVVMR